MTKRTRLVLSFLMILPAILGGQSIQPVNRPYTNSLSAAGDSMNPVFSGDSRHLVFESSANNVVTNDDRLPYTDLFLQTLENGAMELLSVTTNGWGGGNGHSVMATVSSNGQRVVFLSEADNLVGNDTNGQWDVFLRDRHSNQTRLVTTAASGQGSALGGNLFDNQRLSDEPLLTGDGRWVVFASRATNLVSLLDNNDAMDIFAHDVEAGVTWLVSANTAAGRSGNGPSHSASLAHDGNKVAFVSAAHDLTDGVTNQIEEIFVKDLTTGSLVWASRAVDHSTENWAGFYDPVLSANGRMLAFKGRRNEGEMAWGILMDLTTGSNWTTWPAEIKADSVMQFSADGRYVVYDTSNQVFLWDLETSDTPGALEFFDAPCNSGSIPRPAPSQNPGISADGRIITYVIPGCSYQQNDFTVVYVDAVHVYYDRSTGLPRGLGPTETPLHRPAISPNGEFIASHTGYPWIALDINESQDVYLHTVSNSSWRIISTAHPDRLARLAGGMPRSSAGSLSVNGDTVLLEADSFQHGFVDTNNVRDLFVYQAATGKLIPLNTAKIEADWPPEYERRTNDVFVSLKKPVDPMLSADGNFVLYGRPASDGQICEVCPEEGEVWRQDLRDGSLQRVAGESVHGTLNRDGMLATFQAMGAALDHDWLSFTYSNIFLVNFRPPFNASRPYFYAGPSPQVITTTWNGLEEPNDHSVDLGFSPDNRWVFFLSKATNLLPEPLERGPWRVYARDLHRNLTRLISRDEQGVPLDISSKSVVISANARFVAFATEGGERIYCHDLLGDAVNRLVCSECKEPSLTGDGSVVAYATFPQKGNPGQVFLKDMDLNRVRVVSLNPDTGMTAEEDAYSPILSHDARFVYFVSAAGNLVSNDHNRVRDIFVLDRWNDLLVPVSRAFEGGRTGRGQSSDPMVSADGRTVVFQSFADDLTDGDYNQSRDLFMARVGGGDGDEDGMDDDWEMAFFDTLDRGGEGDFDEDGATDLDEFKSGTNPTDDRSRLAFLKIAQVEFDSRIDVHFHLAWKSNPGRSYRVELKGKSDGSKWEDVSGPIFASGSVASFDFLDWRVGLRGLPRQAYFRVRLEE